MTRVNQSEIVRRALQDLGMDAKPRTLRPYIKEKYEQDIDESVISNTKSLYKRKLAQEGQVVPSTSTPLSPQSGRLTVGDLQQVKDFVDQLGGLDQAREALKALEKLR